MPAFLKLIGVIGVWAGDNAQLIVVVGIFITTLVQCIQTYASNRLLKKDMVIQQGKCDGRFNEHRVEIKNLKETQKESHALAKEANDIVKTIKPKMDDIHDWWFKTVMDDKNKNIKMEKVD